MILFYQATPTATSGALTMRIVGAAPRDSGATGGNELTIRAFDR
jgi:hypothetical protein